MMASISLKNALLTAVILLLSLPAWSANLTQTIRGTVIDEDTQQPIIGATVILKDSDPIVGVTTDINGQFSIPNVPVGRATLIFRFLGYEEKMLSNLEVTSSRQVVVNVSLIESVVTLKAAEISASGNEKGESMNEMATVSARAFSVEETKRYAGNFNDPARMVSGYAGVTGDPQGNNDIVVRGNSPKGILWRVEGIEVPNPNHFGGEGATGGPISLLNSDLLDNSDFYSGAFPAEYGNALSGVFDIRFRKGNNQDRQYSLEIGALGIDATAEGPFSKNGRASYLVNYRYSSLALLDNVGVVDFQGIPKYQDGAFNVFLPTEKAGNFTVFGFGGLSTIQQSYTDEENEELVHSKGDFGSFMGAGGINHFISTGKRSYLRSSLTISTNGSTYDYWENNEADEFELRDDNTNQMINLKAATTYNIKLNKRHKLRAGAIYTRQYFDNYWLSYDQETQKMETLFNSDGNTGYLQSFLHWKTRIGANLDIHSGAHVLYFEQNQQVSVEPRVGAEWKFAERQSLKLGAGIHSRMEPLSTYHGWTNPTVGVPYQPNLNLGLSRAAHGVIGYNWQFGKNMRLMTEAYYQHLFDVPVENDPSSSYSLINETVGYDTDPLVNDGYGRNYGLELTLERFFAKQFYFLLTGSLYQSEYKAMDGVWRETRFNGNYAANFLSGKEFNIGKSDKKKRILGVNTKLSVLGGGKYTAVDLDESIAKGYQVMSDNYLGENSDDVLQLNLAVYYKVNRKKVTHEFKVDIQNLTNSQAMVQEFYNPYTEKIEKSTQLPLLPVISYRLEF
ncbi:TonB-dependent receptor [bacterium SCSIO 12741]|nr:TonB-dependent receptor [bacterium SCSIO 12741]